MSELDVSSGGDIGAGRTGRIILVVRGRFDQVGRPEQTFIDLPLDFLVRFVDCATIIDGHVISFDCVSSWTSWKEFIGDDVRKNSHRLDNPTMILDPGLASEASITGFASFT